MTEGQVQSASVGPLDLEALAAALRQGDRSPLFDQLRELPSICRDERRGLWFATSYEACAQILRDPRFSSDSRNANVIDAGTEPSAALGGSEMPLRPYLFFDPAPYSPGRPFLFADPPDHTRLRRLVSRAFTPKVVTDLRPRIEALVGELLAPIGDRFELIDTFAYPLPLRVIMDLLGIGDEHFELIRRWGAPLVGFLDADALRTAEQRDEARLAQFHLGPFFQEQAELRRRQPGDDLLSALVQAEDGGDSLTPFEVVATSILLLLAGHETSVNLIGNGIVALARHRDQLDALRNDPSLAPAAVDEVLRFDPPVQLVARTAIDDAAIDGIEIPRGEHVVLVIAAANRDPARFDRPDDFDLTRSDASAHLSFGLGLHHCIGAPLARAEGEVAFREIAKRFPDLAIDEPVVYRDDVVLRGPDTVQVVVR